MANIKKLPLFVRCVIQNFPFIEEDFDALTNYQLISKVVEYLNKIIKSQNEVITVSNELQSSFIELQNYVEHYFDNLDVQEEINNKLDAMAESGELEALISDFIIGGKGQVKYYFPDRTIKTTQYTIIQSYSKSILVDCGREDEYSNLSGNLSRLGITHLDYIIITHFHEDHAGGFIDLINDGIIDEDTVIYLPTFNTSVWNNNSAYPVYQAIMAKLAEVGYSYINPNEGQVVTLNDAFSFTFYNTNDTYYVDESINNDYNNASLFILFKHFGINTLIIGDAYKHALRKIYYDGVLPDTIHLMNSGHHGISNKDNSNYDVLRHFTIENIVQIVGISDVETGKTSGAGTASDEKNISKNMYVTAYNNDMVQFSSFINSMNLVNGYIASTDGLNNTDVDYYVDSETDDEIQDGSIQHPFKSLSQCLGFCNRNTGVNYTIHVADGTYALWADNLFYKPAITNTNGSIEIVGESKAGTILNGGFKISNASNVIIRDMTITNTIESRLLNIENSNVEIRNCDLSNVSDQRIISCYNSDIIVRNVTFNTGSHGIYEEESNVAIYSASFSNISTYCLYGNAGNFTKITNLVISDASPSYGHGSILPAFTDGYPIFIGEAKYNTNNDHTFTTTTPGGLFKYIEVYYTLRGAKRCRKCEVDTSNQRTQIGINDGFTGSYSENDNYYVEIIFNNTTTATFNCSRKTAITTSEVTFDNADASLTVNKVLGY